MPDTMLEYMSDRMPDRMSDRMPEKMSDRMPDRMPEYMSDTMPKCLSDRMSEYMPNRMSDRMSDRMPENPPAPEVQGAWSSGWHKSTKVQVYLGGGPFIWKKPPVFDRSWCSPSQNAVKNSTERTCSLPRPPNLRQKKSEKTSGFSTFWIHFLGLHRVFFFADVGCDFGPVFGLMFDNF